MPRQLTEEVTNWANGVNTTAAADMLAPGFSPRARNSIIQLLGDGGSRAATRRGALTRNATPLTGAPGIIGGFQYKQKSGTKITLLVSDTGRLDKLNTDDTTTVINATAFTSGVHYPFFAVANNVCFIVNDVEGKKYDGTNLTAFGITRPAAPTAVIAAGGAMTIGSWDVLLTYYNSVTGQESSASNTTTVVTNAGNQKINVSWSAPADAQVTHVRVYVRDQAAGANIYRMVAGATPAPDATTGGFPVATTATVLDISAVQYAAFAILAPSTTENDPPAAGLQYPTWHNNRLFLADTGNVYYSNIKDGTPYPESFNPNNVEPISLNDGDIITGLYSMWGRLFIFKRFSVWMIEGTDPSSWTVSLVSPDHGAVSGRGITSVENVIYFWDGVTGPVAIESGGSPVPFGKQLIEASIDYSVLNQTALTSMTVGVDEQTESVIWAVPEVTQTRNTRLIPFSYRAKKFHSEFWNPFDVYSIFTVETVDRLESLYFGGYSGQVFQWWAAANDGVPLATTTFGNVTAAGSNTLTDSAASFANTGGKLVERYVYAISQDGLTIQRNRITSNTGTVLTCVNNWSPALNTTWTYVVGAADWQIDTPWANGEPFSKKKYEFAYAQVASSDQNVTVTMDVFINLDESAPRRTLTFMVSPGGGVYDAATSLYDTTLFSAPQATFAKKRVGLTGHGWRIRLRHCSPDKSVSLSRIAVQSQVLSRNR